MNDWKRRTRDQLRDSGTDVMAWAVDNPLDAAVAATVVFVLGFAAGWWVWA